MTIISKCLRCLHFNPRFKGDNVCDAFPNGIPVEIRFGNHSHREPYEGDNGIRFEEHPEGTARFDNIKLPPKPQTED